MPRTKQPKNYQRKPTMSRSSSIATNGGLSRVSAIAALASDNDAQFENVATSTPENMYSSSQMKNKKDILKKFKKYTKEDLKNIERMFLDDIAELEGSIAMMRIGIAPAILKKKLKDYKFYQEQLAMEQITNDVSSDEENENVPPNRVQGSAEKFKVPGRPATVVKNNKRSTRSSSRTKTPINPIPYTPVATITPKVNMNQPLSVVRHARLGEQAVSMSGSPIMVSSVPREDVATVSVPLQGGKTVTILPTSGFQREQMPSLNPETKEQLETLYKNLAVFFSDGSP